ncbi:MAG: MBOAT family protein [Acidobacteria bacterium]|nr:MBOAT family protein [Acidobacteriota bacterium]
MLFTAPSFLFIFLPVVLALHLAPHPVWRNTLLLAASVVFYASGAGAFTTLILASIAGNYLAALAIDRWRDGARGRWLLRGTIAANLAVLVVFKYTGFLGANLNAALGWLGLSAWPIPSVTLPIGISFFTFHAISYVVDVARQDAVAQKRPMEAALYLLFFPQLIAGPIIRYREIADQLPVRTVTLDDMAYGVRRFVIGLAKKMLIANTLALPADRIFALAPADLTTGTAWLGVVCYTLQLYFDFSGYSDMALGLGRMFGFRFPENFRYPYAATSVQDFWRRWHLSLSAWFRDYLYVPLGGNRVAPVRVYLNLVTVFALCGLWHGANWTFVVWGLFHGFFLVVERMAGQARRSTATGAWRLAGHAYALVVVMVGWVFFRAASLTEAMQMLSAMAGVSSAPMPVYDAIWFVNPEVALALVAGAVGATPIAPRLARALAVGDVAGAAPSWLPGGTSAGVVVVLSVLFAVSVLLSAAGTYSPFIYFRF